MTKEELLNQRNAFFKEVASHIQTAPSRIDEILNQNKYYVRPSNEDIIINSNYGDMIIKINGSFYGRNFHLFYSLWQVSDTIKIGIALCDEELHGAFTSDTHNEVYYIWGWKNDPKIDVARGIVFYDWEFDVPNLYDSYKNQERFILGVKHMHFRTMRIIHDECERLFFKNGDEADELNISNLLNLKK